MLSPKFEHVKQRYPGLSPLLDRVGQYIQSHVRDGQEYVIPKLAAAALHLNDGEAFVLLDLLAKEGVLRRVYNVYCRKNNALLATVDNLEALDEVSHCDFCDVDHDPSDLRAEVAFVPAGSDLKDLAA
ncbi:MAG TPA: hypothetical protein VGK36_18625 [Candidatus Angelobacter sp.]|jgi:hypothetical protein